MGSFATPPNSAGPSDESDDGQVSLGDLLSGRLADVDVDSVAVIRSEREP